MTLIQALPPLLTHKYVPSVIPSGKSDAVTGQFFGFRVRSGALLGAVAYLDQKYETPLALWNGRVFTHKFSSIQFAALADPYSISGTLPTKAGPLVIDLLQTNDLQLLGPPEVWNDASTGVDAPLPMAPDADTILLYNRTGQVIAATTDTAIITLQCVSQQKFHGGDLDKYVAWATPATKLVGGLEGSAAFTYRKWSGFWDGSAVQWVETFNRNSSAAVAGGQNVASCDLIDLAFPFFKLSVYSTLGCTLKGCIAARNKT